MKETFFSIKMPNQSVFFLSLIFFCCISCISAAPTVKILNGTIQGIEMKTRNGREISAFLGVAYAHQPTGNYRFDESVSLRKTWNDIRKVEKDGAACLQKIDGKVVGNEDCLFLNIFTPVTKFDKTKDSNLLPVMVWIHGGKFVEGSSSSQIYGPQYLLDRDILLVTINYRLGIFGFFSTGDTAAPGNFGLKDQVLALKWIQENIEFFGGDPKQVTIFGTGAGGVSVHLHALSESTNGLFHQFIIHSGNAYAPWAYKDCKKFESDVKKVSEDLNCKDKKGKNLVSCLQNIKPEEISKKVFWDNGLSFTQLSWIPTNEPDSLNAYLTDNPLKLIEKNKMKDHNFIIGNVNDEGVYFSQNLYLNKSDIFKIRRTVDEFINHTASYYANPKNDKKFKEAVHKYYFNNSIFSMDKLQILDGYNKLITDSYFLYPTTKFLQKVTSKVVNPFYVYSFGYQGKETNAVLAKNSLKNIGIGHKDELLYLFPMKPDRKIDKEDEPLIDIMVDLWTSFAINGNPTTEAVNDPDFWEPYVHSTGYLQISKDPDLSLTLEHTFSPERMDFWETNAFQA